MPSKLGAIQTGDSSVISTESLVFIEELIARNRGLRSASLSERKNRLRDFSEKTETRKS